MVWLRSRLIIILSIFWRSSLLLLLLLWLELLLLLLFWEVMYSETSSQDGGISKHTLPPHTTTEKITTRPQNKYHPAPSENRAVWKSNHQGFKEATFIQMGRRGREAWRQWCGEAVEQADPRSCGVDKNRDGYLGSKGFQRQEDKSP